MSLNDQFEEKNVFVINNYVLKPISHVLTQLPNIINKSTLSFTIGQLVADLPAMKIYAKLIVTTRCKYFVNIGMEFSLRSPFNELHRQYVHKKYNSIYIK